MAATHTIEILAGTRLDARGGANEQLSPSQLAAIMVAGKQFAASGGRGVLLPGTQHAVDFCVRLTGGVKVGKPSISYSSPDYHGALAFIWSRMSDQQHAAVVSQAELGFPTVGKNARQAAKDGIACTRVQFERAGSVSGAVTATKEG